MDVSLWFEQDFAAHLLAQPHHFDSGKRRQRQMAMSCRVEHDPTVRAEDDDATADHHQHAASDR
ncbi:MAG: hypothetical protein F4059_08470 [Gemmatimonadetes bacterium]|nr:hypothetical protein [Gemmatimonadota bacterium]